MACFIMLALTYILLYSNGRIFVNQKVPGHVNNAPWHRFSLS
jgi:hypothetical protein